MTRSFVRGIWLATWLALCGCSLIEPRSVRIDSAAGMYQGVTITYRVDGGQLSEPLTVARISGQQITQERLPSSPYPDRSVARLSIKYPHPDGKAGFALAEMVVETRTPPNVQAQAKKAVWQQWADAVASTARDILPGVKLSDGVYEAWAMDIAKGDLDRVVAGLSQSGYFANPSKPTLGVELAARIDNFQANKRWTREAELDILMERIRQEGQLVSYVHPVEPGGSTTAIAAGQNGNRAILVSHEEEGPALVPAGPQNNAYLNPPETAPPARMPRYIAPVPQYTPPAPSYDPTPTSPSRPATELPSYQRPAAPKALEPPAAKSPTAPNGNPRNRWQYPPQYRRPAPQASPGAAKTPAATQAAPTNRSRVAPQPRSPRTPWQRPAAAAGGQPPAVNQAPDAANIQDPRLQRLRRNSGSPTQQPLPGGRAPSRLQRAPAAAPPPSGPYSANSQSDAAPTNGGYPAGLPQPPQLGSRLAPY